MPFTTVKFSELEDCWSPRRFFGNCGTDCNRVDRCRRPEGAHGHLSKETLALRNIEDALEKQRQVVAEHRAKLEEVAE